jgi:sulfite reductase (NADPH) flavoprotein alpha-component
MFYYFGYGSNINSLALNAKGVYPKTSTPVVLLGWKLKFNVRHWFRHEGGMANIVRTNNNEDVVEGVVHLCEDHDLKPLDLLEAYGIGYDRIKVKTKTTNNTIEAFAYKGLPDVIDNSLLPTHRYKNIIVKGALEHNLSPSYIEELKNQPAFEIPKYPKFEYSFEKVDFKIYNKNTLSKEDYLTALNGYVFDMRNSRAELKSLFNIFGGKDMTLFHLKRLDNSDGKETYKDVIEGNISDQGLEYINTYLHEYQKEFKCVGSYNYESW